MTHDPRDEIWKAIFETYYDAFYNETVADKLITGWQYVDVVTKVVVAITASGSAVAGWSLWTQQGYQTIWASIAGVAALLSIVHAALSVTDRLKDAEDVKRAFSSLRIASETCRKRMRINPEFSIEEFTKQYEELRNRYGDCLQRIKTDVLRTRWLKMRAQSDVDKIVNAEQ